MQTAENFFKSLKNTVFQPAFQAGIFSTTALVLKRAFFLFIPKNAVRLKVKMNR
jgi:hypothetical protein